MGIEEDMSKRKLRRHGFLRSSKLLGGHRDHRPFSFSLFLLPAVQMAPRGQRGERSAPTTFKTDSASRCTTISTPTKTFPGRPFLYPNYSAISPCRSSTSAGRCSLRSSPYLEAGAHLFSHSTWNMPIASGARPRSGGSRCRLSRRIQRKHHSIDGGRSSPSFFCPSGRSRGPARHSGNG